MTEARWRRTIQSTIIPNPPPPMEACEYIESQPFDSQKSVVEDI